MLNKPPSMLIKEEMDRIQAHISYQFIADYASYRFYVGQLDGLKQAYKLLTQQREIND